MKKNYIILGTSILIAVLAVLLANSYLSKERASIWRDNEPVDVVAAIADLQAGTVVNAGMFEIKKVPRKFLQSSAIKAGDIDFSRMTDVKLVSAVRAGDVLLWKDLSTRQETERVSQIVKKGYRALSIPVDTISSVSGFIRPNDHIDLIGTFTIEFPPPRGSEEPMPVKYTTVTLLQNVVVMAVGKITEYTPVQGAIGTDMTDYSTLTVEVTEEEAQQIVFAQSKGKLTALLRNAEDIDTLENTPKTTLETVFKDEFRELLQKKRNRRIEIIRGGQ